MSIEWNSIENLIYEVYEWHIFLILCTFDESQGNSAVSDVIISLFICFFKLESFFHL